MRSGQTFMGEPFHFGPVMLIGTIVGLGLVILGGIAWHRGWDESVGYAFSVGGMVGILGLLLLGRADGYLWPFINGSPVATPRAGTLDLIIFLWLVQHPGRE